LTEISKASRQLTSVYNRQEDVMNLNFSVGAAPGEPPQAAIKQELGKRISSDDLTQIVLLGASNFAVSQLAPYPGWEVFFERFSRDWALWKRTMGYRKVVRVGVRFINRIDVPRTNDDTTIDEADYLNVYPHLPSSLRPFTGYAVQAQLRLHDIGCGLIINSGAVPSPLIGYNSYLLDFDISMEPEPPQRDEDIYELLNRIRVTKNQVFELCVTDRAKEIFRT
jgi:uncharacterized protein (TIGR04255 family)